MKKITLLAVAFVALTAVSCKKDRTCTCKTTTSSYSQTSSGVTVSSTGPFGSTEDKTVMTKVSKKAAAANCVSSENTSTETSASGNSTTTTVTKNDCSLS
jgi:hypothetical protein